MSIPKYDLTIKQENQIEVIPEQMLKVSPSGKIVFVNELIYYLQRKMEITKMVNPIDKAYNVGYQMALDDIMKELIK